MQLSVSKRSQLLQFTFYTEDLGKYLGSIELGKGESSVEFWSWYGVWRIDP